MTGNKPSGIILTDRDRLLLRELGTLRLIDREQARVIGGFRSVTRVNTRLLSLNRAGLLRKFFYGTIAGGRKAIYSLAPKGAALTDSPSGLQRSPGKTLVGDLFVEHQLHLNEIYLLLRYGKLPAATRVRTWRTFSQQISPTVPLIPDAYVELETMQGIRSCFVEVDLGTEPQRIWTQKTTRYLHLALSGEFTRIFHQPQFRVLVIANSLRRLDSIRQTVSKSTDKMFWFSTFEMIQREGFWSTVWFRPTGDLRQSLL